MSEFKFSTKDLCRWDYLNYLKFEIEFAIEAYRRYLSENTNIINKIHEQLQKTIEEDEELASLEEEWKSSYEDQVYYFDRKVNESIVRTHAFSSFLSLMAFTEGMMKEICNKLEAKTNSVIIVNDLNGGNYLRQYWIYLTKVVQIELSTVEPYFTPISQYYGLRNKVAHENAAISEKQIEFIKGEPNLGLSYDNKSFYIKNNHFLKTLVDKIETFFFKLIKAIDTKISKTD